MTQSLSSKQTEAPSRLLDTIRSPADIKALREEDLPQLAQEVRENLIKVLSQTGGHLGPNLGVVELTIALHRVFTTPQDKFVFDVSHQGYVHKMFTGRLDRIDTMRQYEGLNGFLLRTESEHDCYGAGSRRHGALRCAWEWRSGAICAERMKMSWSSRATPRLPAESVTRR